MIYISHTSHNWTVSLFEISVISGIPVTGRDLVKPQWDRTIGCPTNLRSPASAGTKT